MKQKILDFILKILLIFSLILIIITGIIVYFKAKKVEERFEANQNSQSNQLILKESELENKNIIINTNNNESENYIVELPEEVKIDDWRLILVNHENSLPEDFTVQLANIDSSRQFDARAIEELNQMIKDMRKQGVSNIWVQSAYRSIEYQNELFNDKVNEYVSIGKTKQEAEELALRIINKSETSEHNLGLAVDFNYVSYNFEKTKEFKWLIENAENYGFILRYQKEKENITGVMYEPWHWRYVGKEHAKRINELEMCLEEYINFLKTENKKNVK